MNNTENSVALPFIEKYFLPLFLLLFITGLLLSLLYSNHQILTGDQEQMLDKGYLGATKGIWLSYGNAASAIGNVPGSLSAYIIGAPLSLWFSPWAPMMFLILLHICSFYLFDAVIKQVFGSSVRLLFLVLYWLNPWFLFESLLYNPSYLFFFTALHFWSAFNMHQKKSLLYTFLHLMSIGMAMQLHYSWPILAIISSYLFFRGIIKVHWMGVLYSALLILASLTPYFLELISNQDISGTDQQGDRYIGWGGVHVFPVLKAFLYWIRYASFLFSGQLTSGATFAWLSSNTLLSTIAIYCWQAILYLVGGISLLLSLLANRNALLIIKPYLEKNSSDHELSLENWILLYVVGTLLAILVSAILSPITFNHWHLILIFPIALMPLLIQINNWAKTRPATFSTYLLFVVPYFLIVNLIAAHDSEKFSFAVSYQQQALEYINTETAQ